jgi:peptidoglycan L-alanyl-D-glutamate endopeptidase CwlK
LAGGIITLLGTLFFFRKNISNFIMNTRSELNLKGIHPKLVNVIRTAAETSPIAFTVTDGLRTTAQQQALYAKGRTAAGSVVTNADGVKSKSNHQAKADGYGYAVDLYASPNGVVNYDTTSLKKIAAHIKTVAAKLGVAIRWGGDFSSITDYPHFELA